MAAASPAWAERSVNAGSKQTGEEVPRFDFKFAGGSPGELIEALREASGQPVNALIPHGAEIFVMPAMEYRNVTVGMVLAPLTSASTSGAFYLVDDQLPDSKRRRVVRSPKSAFEWRMATTGKGGNEVWVMNVVFPPEPSTPDLHVEPVNLRRQLEHYSVEDVTTAVDAAWKLQSASDEVKLLFHPETSILLIRGTERDISMALNVIERIDLSQPKPSPPIYIEVEGEVRNPGPYKLPAGGTVLDALRAAGGTTEAADLAEVRISIGGENGPFKPPANIIAIRQDRAKNVTLDDGYTIYVDSEER